MSPSVLDAIVLHARERETTLPVLSYAVGDRVRLHGSVEGPKCRRGEVIEVRGDGCIVRHDQPEDMPLFGSIREFGWANSELLPEMELVK